MKIFLQRDLTSMNIYTPLSVAIVDGRTRLKARTHLGYYVWWTESILSKMDNRWLYWLFLNANYIPAYIQNIQTVFHTSKTYP